MVTLLMAKQIIIWGRPRNRKTKGVAINRNSIGTIWINGVPHTYNADLVYKNEVTVDQVIEDSKPKKKKIILVKRK